MYLVSSKIIVLRTLIEKKLYFKDITYTVIGSRFQGFRMSDNEISDY